MLLLLSPGTQRGAGAKTHAPRAHLCELLPCCAICPDVANNSEDILSPSVNSPSFGVFLHLVAFQKIYIYIFTSRKPKK